MTIMSLLKYMQFPHFVLPIFYVNKMRLNCCSKCLCQIVCLFSVFCNCVRGMLVCNLLISFLSIFMSIKYTSTVQLFNFL